MATKNIFVVGLDDFNLRQMKQVMDAEDYNFLELLDFETVKGRGGNEYPFNDVLEKARRQLREFDGSIDAIVGYWDFPVTTLVPMLGHEFGTTAPTLDSVARCEHKYWSRLLQSEVISEHPDFEVFNPFDDDPLSRFERVGFPMWIKPIKGTSSILAYSVSNEQEFNDAIAEVRREIHHIARGFNELLGHMTLPGPIEYVDGHYCVAESTISGAQCTVSGYVYRGDVVVYGVVDSINYPDSSSFQRYEYPSTLPQHALDRMADISTRLIRHLELSDTTFNIEYFYDEAHDRINLLEINPRMSQSHGDIYRKVDGLPNHQLMIDLGLGQKPRWKHGEGKYNRAAKCFLRDFEGDALVKRVPTREEVDAIARDFPDTLIEILPEEGRQLSDMREQEPYSYELAHIYVGGDDRQDLLDKYNRIVDRLHFELESISVTA